MFYGTDRLIEKVGRYDKNIASSIRTKMQTYRPTYRFISDIFLCDVGPIRADIAFPFKRRKGIDDMFQFYFGIGQSF